MPRTKATSARKKSKAKKTKSISRGTQLTSEELLEMELFAQKRRNMRLEIINLGNKLEKLRLDISNTTNQINTIKAQEGLLKQDHTSLINKLSSKYSLGEQWGYNPDTGDIMPPEINQKE